MNFIDYIFPRHCISCGNQAAYLCKQCKKQLQPHPEICPICHRFSHDYKTCINCRSNKEFGIRTPIPNSGIGGENHTGDFGNIKYEGKGSNLGSQKRSVYLEGIIIPFVYTDFLKTLIIKLKYFHKKDIGEFLVERLAIALQANTTLQQSFHRSIVLITFIPSHRYRHYFIKGYNQSELLAKKLSQHLQVPMVAVAKKQKHTKTQASLDRNGRMKNLNNAFSLTKNLSLTGNETLLIVDDITTTGSTINELAKLIKHYYPNMKIRGAVLGRHI